MPTINQHIPERLEFAIKSQKTHRLWGIDVAWGEGCLFKEGSVIGQKGFSFGFTEDLTPVPIVHTGGVRIGNNVEVGALCTIAAGTVDPTIIEDHVKIDDHVHIAHNCHIGEKTCIAAGVIFGGSVKVGKCVWIGHGATIMNGITIGDLAVIGSGSVVIRDVPVGHVVAGNPAKFLKIRNELK